MRIVCVTRVTRARRLRPSREAPCVSGLLLLLTSVMDAAAAAGSAAALGRGRRVQESRGGYMYMYISEPPAVIRHLPLLLLLLPPLLLQESAAGVSIQCTKGTEKSGSGTTANWPTYHFMNNVTRDVASGALLLEPLNDANAIAEYKGVYHVMMQEGGGNWSHGVSNDSEHQHQPSCCYLCQFPYMYLSALSPTDLSTAVVRWYLIEDALDSGPKSIGFPDVAPCDGSL